MGCWSYWGLKEDINSKTEGYRQPYQNDTLAFSFLIQWSHCYVEKHTETEAARCPDLELIEHWTALANSIERKT